MKTPTSIFILFLLFSSLIFGQTTRYVTSAGAGNKSGDSWENASNDLQAMINASSSGDKIYVAVGIYMPNRRADATGTITPNDRRNSFVMKQDVSIYGGFDPANGITEDLNSRILPGTGSGSLLSGNLGNISFIDDNAYHVVVAAGGSNAGLLDGFIIQDGNARGDNTMTINGQGVTSKGGGGIASVNAEVRFINCWIRGNQSNSGGGAYIAMASTGLSFTSHFTNCIFSGNYVSTLSGNNGNGGAIYSLSGRVRLSNCTISSNRASGGRGGAILSSGNIYLYNTILHGNTAANGQNGVRIDSGSFVAEYSLIGDSGDNLTSSTSVTSGNPSFVNEPGTGGAMPTTTGNYRLNLNSACIDTGNNSLVLSGVITSIGGFGRILGGTVDRGAFESTPAPNVSALEYCVGNILSDLAAEGENLKWYDVAQGGSPLGLSTEVVTDTYYLSQTINGWEGPRVAVNVTCAIENPSAPSPQNFSFSGVQVSNLEATGENLKWYSAATGGEALQVILSGGIYYVSQTIDGCESERTSVTITFTYTTRYVKPVASGTGNGSSWENASDDLQAILNASSNGNYIFIAGGVYKPNRMANALDIITPNHRDNAFVLKTDVKIYGGFAGTESSIEERDLSDSANTTILSGDFYDNDIISGLGETLTFSNNEENAYHVIISANNSGMAEVDGLTVKGGNANGGHNYITVEGINYGRDEAGGLYGYGIVHIRNCIFTENNASFMGGVMRILETTYTNYENNIKISNTIFYKNKADAGSVIRYSKYFNPLLMSNCIIYGNRSNFNNPFSYATDEIKIYNSIVYGNDETPDYLTSNNVRFYYSLVEGVHAAYYSSPYNNIDTDPLFVNAAEGNFRLQITSPAINRGNNSYVPSDVFTDIAGNPRLYGASVDMGSYEYQNAQGVIWTTSNNWLNNIEPDADKEVFIQGNLLLGTDYGNFEAKTLTVEPGGSITIGTGNTVTVFGKIKNSNSVEDQANAFIVRSGGNLIQTEDYETDDNEGKITVERDSNPIVRLDYAFWSSPVKGQQLQAFSPMTLPNRIYTYETNSGNQSTNGAYEVVSNVNNNFVPGKGYLFRAPNDWIPEDAEAGEAYQGKFMGEPSNGDISIATYPNGFTSLGNPYPSNLDPEKLLMSNSGLSNVFFWNNPDRVYNEGTGSWGYAPGSHYVAYSSLGFNAPEYEGRSISVGQGFIVYTTGSNVHFDNSMRTAETESFFKTNETERHRFWLRLKDKDGPTLNDILIGYMEGATNGIDQKIEGEQFGYEGSALYNLIEERKYSIQGRILPFDTSDVVPLGFRSEQADKYTISLTAFDGLFSEGHAVIYLRDKALNKIHNLMESDYEFESPQGEFKNRFEIVYQEEEGTMATGDETGNEVEIYQHNGNIIIDSKAEKIISVELYDMQGRALYRKDKIRINHYEIRSAGFGPVVMVVKVQTQKGKNVTKKLLNRQG